MIYEKCSVLESCSLYSSSDEKRVTHLYLRAKSEWRDEVEGQFIPAWRFRFFIPGDTQPYEEV
jgi:hypothetical protein